MDSTSQSNKALISQILRAYGQGDWRPLLNAIDDDVAWQSHASLPHYRFGGARRGHDGVTEALAQIATEYAIQRYDVKEIISEGNTVWAFSEGHYHHAHAKKLVVLQIVTRWVLRDGKIIEYDSFFDTAHVLIQLGRLPAE